MKEAVMAEHLCVGEWKSRIKNSAGVWEDDGLLSFFIDQATGAFYGSHIYPDFHVNSVWGFCTHPNNGSGAHTIHIWEPLAGNKAYRFFGVITEDAAGQKHKARGSRKLIVKFVSEAQKRILLSNKEAEILLADADWEADKTT